MTGRLEERAGAVLDAGSSAFASPCGSEEPAPIASHRSDGWGAVLFGVAKPGGAARALYGLYAQDPRSGAWMEIAIHGSDWFETEFSQPVYAPGLPLAECLAAATHGDEGGIRVYVVPGRVVEGVEEVRLTSADQAVQLGAAGAFIALGVSSAQSPPPQLVVRRGDRVCSLEPFG